MQKGLKRAGVSSVVSKTGAILQAIQKYKQFLALCITSKNTQGEARVAGERWRDGSDFLQDFDITPDMQYKNSTYSVYINMYILYTLAFV